MHVAFIGITKFHTVSTWETWRRLVISLSVSHLPLLEFMFEMHKKVANKINMGLYMIEEFWGLLHQFDIDIIASWSCFVWYIFCKHTDFIVLPFFGLSAVDPESVIFGNPKQFFLGLFIYLLQWLIWFLFWKLDLSFYCFSIGYSFVYFLKFTFILYWS